MGRFLSLLLLSVSFASSATWAAAIGQVSAFSKENKPLRMDIELVDLQGVRINDVLMRVADEIDHERFGLQRPSWADGSFARVLNKDSNSFVARLSSTRAVSDSNVDFVVELRAGGAVTWHKVSASLGSGSPLVALPVEPKPAIEKPAPAAAPAPTPVAEVVPVAEEALIADDTATENDLGLEDTTISAEQAMAAEPALEELTPAEDTFGMSTSTVDDADSESKLKPHQYFNRALILFFILCFVIAGVIGKVVKKVRKK